MLNSKIESGANFKRLAGLLSAGVSSVAGELWGGAAGVVLCRLSEKLGRPLLVVTKGEEESDLTLSDCNTFSSGRADLFPAVDIEPGEFEFSGMELLGQRSFILRDLRERKKSKSKTQILVAPLRALLQPLPPPKELESQSLHLHVEETYNIEDIKKWLVDKGFRSQPMVELRGEFSSRGGILDIFPLAGENPVRLEFYGDILESIREFEVVNQRSVTELKRVILEPAGLVRLVPHSDSSLLGDYLSEDWIVVWLDRREIVNMADALVKREPDRTIVPLTYFENSVSKLVSLEVDPLYREGGVNFTVTSVQKFERDLPDALGELMDICMSGSKVFIYCNNDGERDRLAALCADEGFELNKSAELEIGTISHGVYMRDIDLYLLADHEIFGRYRDRLRPMRRKDSVPISDFIDLSEGDYIVHVEHGVGKYMGLAKLQIRDHEEEFLLLLYAEGAKIYVPANNLHLVQKYIGGSADVTPKLDTIGGKAWQTRKNRVQTAILDLAEDLLQLHALRREKPGYAFPPDDENQRRFEASFIYEETPDQTTGNADIRADMIKPMPMDRLLCGDVGFGKTELAVRAAFKCLLAGKQTAVLVPTTILAEQHYRTFSERMAEYPALVASLSRFRTPMEQAGIVQRLREGTIDVVIGTHRLLSKDVEFADLGLVIIDEEQKFGVESKERLKHLRATVDVLTLTATPIPRTLHMSLLGLKDISMLTTPPADRLAVITKVVIYDDKLIRQAVLRELNREGQVFFVHNRVFDINKVARELQRIVPEARIGTAHGQMPEKNLKDVMEAFVDKKLDVLVSTTIVESGLDIPNVNTLLVNNAHHFGLADLHQLRGRIGRYRHRAFAYFMIPGSEPIAEIARRRLQAIEEFSELGAGFKIAMRDMEIRGAGNLLGKEQSGHIEEVGYEMYCRMLDTTVRRLKNDPNIEEEEFLRAFDVAINIKLDALIPDEYIPGRDLKLEMYRKLTEARSAEEIDAVRAEMEDRFGEPPQQVLNLLDVLEIRIHAKKARIKSIDQEGELLLIKSPNLRERGFEKKIGLRDKYLEYIYADVAAFRLSKLKIPITDFLKEILPRLAAQ